MKREIKFRAWDNINKSMYNVRDIDFLANAEINSIRLVVCVQTSDDDIDFDFPIRRKGEYELMQFTGLKDNNGKEIYDGDILTGGFTVVYYNGAFGFWAKENSVPNFFMLYRYLRSNKVIGNIYENPELLTE